MMNKTSIDESQNLEDGSDRETKKESDRVHVSTCLQRDSETREYTKADTGLSHNLALPQLQVDIDACIMSLPQGDGSGEPGILIGLPSLIESGLLTSVLTGDINLQRAADSDLDADPIEQWETMGRDEIGDTVQSVNQGTAAFALPTVDGTDAEKAAIWSVISKYKQLFGPPPLGGSKLRPMSIELKPGAAIPKPAPARRVSPDILHCRRSGRMSSCASHKAGCAKLWWVTGAGLLHRWLLRSNQARLGAGYVGITGL